MAGILSKMFSLDIGIDLGTATTLVYVKGQGIVLAEPSVVAIKTGTKQVFGGRGRCQADARPARPATSSPIRPMKDGVIADFAVTQNMLA